MESVKLYIVIVFYNFNISNSITINRALSKILNENIRLIIVDNSTDIKIKEQNKEMCINKKYTYLDMDGNQGISKAYNSALKWTKEKDNLDESWIMLLDQDTIVDLQYFDNVLKSIKNNPQVLIKTGQVFSDNNLLSPWKAGENRNKVNQVGIFENIEFINSGMVVKGSIYRNIGFYDETLFLDMIDYYFIYQLRKNGVSSVEVVDGKIRQDFSGNQFSTLDRDKTRFKIFSKDFKRYCYLSGKNWMYKVVVLSKRALKLSLYHKANFFKYM